MLFLPMSEVKTSHPSTKSIYRSNPLKNVCITILLTGCKFSYELYEQWLMHLHLIIILKISVSEYFQTY